MSDLKLSSGEIVTERPWYKEINKMQWNALAAAFLGWVLDAFDVLLYSFTIVSLVKEWDLTTTQIGLVASVTVAASAFGGMFFGFLADRWGRLKALTISILIYSFATGACGLAQDLWQLMAARVIVGLGMGGEWSAGAALVAETWPAKHRGKAMSIMQSGYALGGILASFIAGPVIAAYGWRTLFFIGVLPALLVWWIRRSVEEPEVWRKNQAAEAASAEGRTSWLDLFRGEVLKTTIIGSVFCVVGLVCSYPSTTWLPAYLGSPVEKGGLGLPPLQSSWYMMIFFLGAIAGYWVYGWLSDKIGRKPAFAGFFLLGGATLATLVLTGASNLMVFVPLLFITGAGAMGYYGGFGIVIGEMYPTRLRASGQGFCYNLARGVAAFSLTAVGVIAQKVGLGNALLYASGFIFFALLALLIVPETKGTEFH